ncbi:MAG TPA: serine O-acetyltransferase [Rhizobiales bacterium]|nr:serine O-acetyltransferase [Hyphomicrobiales bacterium]
MSVRTVNLAKLELVDPVWHRMRQEAEDIAGNDPTLGSFIFGAVLNHETFDAALLHRLARRLGNTDVSNDLVEQALGEALAGDPEIANAARADILATFERDPACDRYIEPFLFYKGFMAVQIYRLGHQLWKMGRRDFALHLQSRCSALFSIDIHPAAKIGKGLMIDHAHSIVIGETAVVGDNVSMLHSVTLGGTGKDHGDRHPKVGDFVLIGAGASILGNITVGSCSRIAAGSVVLHDVPKNRTVAGVPARIVGYAGCAEPARTMNQQIDDGN